MRVLRKGLKGDDIKQWQLFLHGQGFIFTSARDGVFGPETEKLTRAFQKAHKLKDDGIVGNASFGVAMQLGFEAVDFTAEPEAKYPAEPNFEAIVGSAGRQAIFGPLKFMGAPGGDFGKESIRITNDFEAAKVVRVAVPELIGIKGAGTSGKARFHRLGALQLQGLWAAWGRKGLLKHILTWDGSFAVVSFAAAPAALAITLSRRPSTSMPMKTRSELSQHFPAKRDAFSNSCLSLTSSASTGVVISPEGTGCISRSPKS